MNITDAVSLFIGYSDTSRRRSTADTETLFKITDDGVILEVEYKDDDGNTIADYKVPTNIYNINDEYIMFSFSVEQYLVNKTTGSVYENPNLVSEYYGASDEHGSHSSFLNTSKILSDSNNNIYYCSYDDDHLDLGIIKIDVSDPDNLVKYEYTPANDNPAYYTIDSDGNMIYSNDASPWYGTTRMKFGSSYQNLATSEVCSFWFGLDGKIRYIIDGPYLNTMVINSDNTASLESSDFFIANVHPSLSGSKIFKFIDYIIIVDILNGHVIEVEPSVAEYDISSTGISNYELVEQSDSYVYIYGDQTLVKINPSDGTTETLVDSSDNLDLYSFYVDSEETINFSALRMSDGTYILGTIDSNGLVFINEEYEDTGNPVSLVKVQ
jgi:hypothetical protein